MSAFYDGQQDYIDKLNEMYDAFEGGPYAALPISGGRLTGPLHLDVALEVTSGGTGSNTLAGAQVALGIPRPPTSQGKKILIYGSSVASGYGSTGNSQGWSYRLAQALAPQGYSMVNKSIWGNNTAALAARFYTDVVPENPDFVIIGMSIANEGLIGASDKEAVYGTYILGILRLVSMCRAQGYKVIVTGVYSNNDYTATDYQYLKQADQELENADFPYINFLGAVDDGTGKWRTGMWVDNAHPNNNGHEAMFRAIPISLFNSMLGLLEQPPVVDAPYTITMGPTTGIIPVKYVSESPFGSFTAMCKVRRKPGYPAVVPIISVESSLNSYVFARVRNSPDQYSLSINPVGAVPAGEIPSGINSSNNESVHLAITYDYFSGVWKFYADGVFMGTHTANTDSQNYNRIAFGNNSASTGFSVEGYEFSGMAVWRAALNPEQIIEAMNGRYSKASLNLLSPCVESSVPQNSRLVNLASSETFALIGAVGATASLTSSMPGLKYKVLPTGRGLTIPSENVFAPIRRTAASSGASFTIVCSVRKPSSAGNGKAVMGVALSGADVFRIRTNATTGFLEIVDGAGASVMASSTAPNQNSPIQIALRYDVTTGQLSLLVGGTLVGSVSVSPFTYTDVLFAGAFTANTINPAGYEYTVLGMYSKALTETQLLRAAQGDFLEDSIVFLTPGYEKQYATDAAITPGLIYKGTAAMNSVI